MSEKDGIGQPDSELCRAIANNRSEFHPCVARNAPNPAFVSPSLCCANSTSVAMVIAMHRFVVADTTVTVLRALTAKIAVCVKNSADDLKPGQEL
ncbi:hypothetical protein GCM10022267_35260 [Lentzea roselyniae]|uniref:Uncharacterized protein n=1 Tax=Lentzea roselyniae TaxID=531940 RepID=A0ABP7B0S1_9PSEU